MSGTTSHGSQLFDEGMGLLDPVSCYHPNGPVSDVLGTSPGTRSVAIVGLGVGGLAIYGGPGDTYTFYEIDPVVEELARDPRHFTLLSGAAADIEVVIGDGRLELERAQPSSRAPVFLIGTSDLQLGSNAPETTQPEPVRPKLTAYTVSGTLGPRPPPTSSCS